MEPESQAQAASQWLFPIDALNVTPSVATSSIPLSKELYDRARGVEFLFRIGSSLQLPSTAIFTAATWFHRFYMRFSLEDYHRQDVAAACIFLATKTDECGRKLRDVARVHQSKVTGISYDDVSKEDVERCQDIILATEEILLEALCFDFVIATPHEHLVDLFDWKSDQSPDPIHELAWCIAHDSYRTPLCVLFDARVIAAACYTLAQHVCEGTNSPSLDARISPLAPSASLPTPPSHKPTSPDATRFAIERFRFSEPELDALAEALSLLLEFYASYNTQPMQYLRPLTSIAPPKTKTQRSRLYAPVTESTGQIREPPTNALPPMNERTPDSTHEPQSPAKTPSGPRGWRAVNTEAEIRSGTRQQPVHTNHP